MPTEHTSRREVLQAIESVPALSDLLATTDGRYEYELDLEVSVYGRNYQGKRVGPYIRLLTFAPGETVIRQGDWGGNTFYVGVEGSLDVFLETAGSPERKVAQIPAGRQFGELSVLAGVPRAATVRAPGDAAARIIEIQRPALRLLRKIAKFRESLDGSYLHHGRMSALQRMQIQRSLADEIVTAGDDLSQFRVLAKNHLLVREGTPMDRMFIVKEGWLKRSSATTGASDFLGRGHCLGLEGLQQAQTWPFSVVVLARSEVLTLPFETLRQMPGLAAQVEAEMAAFAAPPLVSAPALAGPAATHIMAAREQVIDTGLTDATNLLLMDMDLCVRCGRCSMACHQVHGRSRLVRRGIGLKRPVPGRSLATQALLAPMVCLHCQDPECLTGCPTGAISRLAEGQIDINGRTCIGCGDCAVNCPYGAISMVPRKQPTAPELTVRARALDLVQIRPAPLPAPANPIEDLQAVKCNLCAGTPLNPAGATTAAYGCEESCPTGALIRTRPLDYFDELSAIEGAAYPPRSGSHRENFHVRDRRRELIHASGSLLLLVATGATLYAVSRHGLDGALQAWLSPRWITGLVGLVAILAAMAYPVRRQIFRRRAGALRYWMLGHLYLGVLGAVMILIHGGARAGGWLTTLLALSFDGVILSGLWGLVCYRLLPRLLTAIEGQHLLVDEIPALRDELEERAFTGGPQLSAVLHSVVIPALTSPLFFIRHYVRREPLAVLQEQVRARWTKQRAALPQAVQAEFDRSIDCLVEARRLDAQLLLHRLLRSWLLPHVVATSIMLALLAVHVVQVVFGS